MKLKCCVPNCGRKFCIGSKEVHLFQLPTDQVLRDKWIANVGGQDILKPKAKVCDVHFDLCYYKSEKRNRLEKGAIPTLFLPDSQVDNALESTSTNITAEEIDGRTTNLIKVLGDDSKSTKLTPEIVKNCGSVLKVLREQSLTSTSNKFFLDQTAFKILLTELTKSKSGNEIGNETQIVDGEYPVIDLCDNESSHNVNLTQFQMPVDSNFITNEGVSPSLDDATSNLIRVICDKSEDPKLTPKIVDVRTLVPGKAPKVFHIKTNNVQKPHEKKAPSNSTVKNGSSVVGISKQHSAIVLDQTASKKLLAELLKKSKGRNQIGHEIQTVNPIIDLCDDESTNNANTVQPPIDSNFITNRDVFQSLDDGVRNLIEVIDDESKNAKLTPKIVDIRTVIPDESPNKSFHTKANNVPTTHETKPAPSPIVRNGGSVLEILKQQSQASPSNKIFLNQTAFNILLTELINSKNDNQIGSEIQVDEAANPVIDLCDNESTHNANSIQLQNPVDSQGVPPSLDDDMSNLIRFRDKSENPKLTPKIVDVRTLVPGKAPKIFHINRNNVPKSYEKKTSSSFTVKNGSSVLGISKQHNAIVLDQTASKALLTELLKKSKGHNQIGNEIQTVNPIIDLCDDESTNNANTVQLPIDSNFITNKAGLGVSPNLNDRTSNLIRLAYDESGPIAKLTPKIVDVRTVIPDTPSLESSSDLYILTSKNLSTICRICLREKDVSKLSENNYNEKTYAELLELCSVIKLQEHPSLSQNICSDCAEELLQAYKFRQKCSNSEQTLVNFKAELAKFEEWNNRMCERKRNLTLSFHDYDHTLSEDDVQSLTKPEDRRCTPQKEYKKHFYLTKEGFFEERKGVKFKVIDEANAKNLLDWNTLCNDADDVLSPSDSILRNALIRNLNKRKMMAYTRATNKIHTSNAVIRKKPKAPKKQKSESQPKKKKLVVPGICEICQEPYNTVDEYKQHAKATRHYFNPYVCQYCGKIYPTGYRLKTHTKIKHEQTKAHMCEKCGQCFTTKGSLSMHQKTHIKTKYYTCKVCKACFRTPQDVIRHTRVLHKTNEEKSVCCEFCGDVFTHIGTLRHHTNRLHLNIKLHFCQICNKGYEFKSALKRHMMTHSTLQYDCRFCNKTFRKRSPYLEHIKTQHPGTDENTKEEDEIKWIECNYCDKVCRNKQLYSIHAREDHKEHICIYCDALFESADELNDHLQARHADIPNFSCRYCGRRFPESHSLFSHLDNHRARIYQCNLCFRKFPNNIRLKVHMCMHTREKGQACQYCGKIFQHSSGRKIHERLHTGERPYVCDICGKRDICSSNYKKHQKTHILPIPINEGTNTTEIIDGNMEI